jgi:hypothetical protein
MTARAENRPRWVLRGISGRVLEENEDARTDSQILYLQAWHR